MRRFGKQLGMKQRVFMIVFALLALGAGGKLAYDLARGGSPLAENEEGSSFTKCGLCAAHKADLDNIRRENEARFLLDGSSDLSAE